MTLSDLASIATVFSGVAVLISLIYLGQQIRQNTKFTKADTQQARNQQSIDFLLLHVTNPVVNELWLRGSSCESMSREQDMAYVNFSMAQLSYAENLFYQHREGLIDDRQHRATASWIRYMLSSPGFRAVWTQSKEFYDPEFRDFLEAIVPEARATTTVDPGSLWRSAIAEELALTRR